MGMAPLICWDFKINFVIYKISGMSVPAVSLEVLAHVVRSQPIPSAPKQ